mgnify:CR=1 FL=1
MKHVPLPTSRGLVLLAVLSPAAAAQWSTDPALNSAICVQPGDQTVPQIAAGADGGTWMGWFDNRGGAYAVYAQHLLADGTESLPPNGLALSTHPQNTSLIGWDMQSDGEGNALAVFTDVRAGGDLDVYAYKLSPTGQFLWGPDGITVSVNTDFDANPVVASLSNGDVAVAWARIPSSGTGAVHIRRYTSAGAFLHEATISGATGEKPSFVALAASDNGACIVQWLRNTASFSSPRHIRAQKFDAAGAPLWNGGNPVSVFDASSVPIAHQPLLASDDAGGAWLAWHAAPVSTFTSYVQHLDASGAELFPHNGVSVALEPGVQQLSPSLAVMPAGEAIVVFNRRNSAQSQWGVGAQRISAAGARLWSDAGVSVEPLDGKNESFERVVRFGDGALAMFFDQPQTPLPGSRVRGVRLEGDGSFVWLSNTLSVSAVLAGKDDLELVIDRSGVARAVWRDERNDIGDVFAQSLNPDGALGGASACVSAVFCQTSPNSVGAGARMQAEGSSSVGWGDFELRVDGCPALVNGIFFGGPQSMPAAPFFGGSLCLQPPFARLGLVTTDSGGGASLVVDLASPANPALNTAIGASAGFQFWYRDNASSGASTNVSDGVWSYFCP